MADFRLVVPDAGASPSGSTIPVVLASASPARLDTLRRAGLDPQVQVSDVDEESLSTAAGPTSVQGLVALLARAKAEAVVATRLARADSAEPQLVIGCDSMLELDGLAHGKPGTPQAAVARWRSMRGRTGILRTGHAVALLSPGANVRWAEGVSSTEVRFADISDAEIDAYVATREPLGVAGGFTIDGLGGWFVESVHGDHHGVVGISLPLVRRLLGDLDVPITRVWSPIRASAT